MLHGPAESSNALLAIPRHSRCQSALGSASSNDDPEPTQPECTWSHCEFNLILKLEHAKCFFIPGAIVLRGTCPAHLQAETCLENENPLAFQVVVSKPVLYAGFTQMALP